MRIVLIFTAILLIHMRKCSSKGGKQITHIPLGKDIKPEEFKDLEPSDRRYHPHVHPFLLDKKIKKTHRKSNTTLSPSPLLIPNEQLPPSCPYKFAGEKAYARATCTAFPDRVVCKLGRYTFVINTGENKMDPEIIERFAAMVYHRAQEGDSCFEVEVEQPQEDCMQFVPPKTVTEELTEPPLQPPVFIECSPVQDKTAMCNPGQKNTEVIYSCRQKPLGIGKRMIISVDKWGTVTSDNGLILPPPSAIKERLSRESYFEKLLTPRAPPIVKLFTDECNTITGPTWCPTWVSAKCDLPSCVTTATCEPSTVRNASCSNLTAEIFSKSWKSRENRYRNKRVPYRPEMSFQICMPNEESPGLDQYVLPSRVQKDVDSRSRCVLPKSAPRSMDKFENTGYKPNMSFKFKRQMDKASLCCPPAPPPTCCPPPCPTCPPRILYATSCCPTTCPPPPPPCPTCVHRRRRWIGKRKRRISKTYPQLL